MNTPEIPVHDAFPPEAYPKFSSCLCFGTYIPVNRHVIFMYTYICLFIHYVLLKQDPSMGFVFAFATSSNYGLDSFTPNPKTSGCYRCGLTQIYVLRVQGLGEQGTSNLYERDTL